MARPGTPQRGPGRPGPDATPAPDDDELLALALTTFADLGYEGTSVREICRRLGVSHNLVHQRFGSKEALWYAAIDRGFEELLAQVAESVADHQERDDLERLRTMLVRFLETNADAPELLGIINQEAVTAGPRLDHIYDMFIRPVSDAVQTTLDRLVSNGLVKPVPAGAFHFLVTHGAGGPLSLTALAERFGDVPTPHDAAAAHDYAVWVVDLLLDGIRTR